MLVLGKKLGAGKQNSRTNCRPKICKLLMSGIGQFFELVECKQFTCYDFLVLDSDRHVAC
jgi:hypothetical protein